jgi:hypothetical protein
MIMEDHMQATATFAMLIHSFPWTANNANFKLITINKELLTFSPIVVKVKLSLCF